VDTAGEEFDFAVAFAISGRTGLDAVDANADGADAVGDEITEELMGTGGGVRDSCDCI
jgi:hypothetical protein